VENGSRPPDKDAAVPEELAGRKKLLSHLQGGLFGESTDPESLAGRGAELSAALDIAIPRRRIGRFDADSRQGIGVVLDQLDRFLEDLGKFFRIRDQVVGRQDHHHSLRIAPLQLKGRQADAGSCILAERFDDKL